MDIETSWAAVFNPGKSNVFFDVHNLPKFQPKATGNNLSNAWWLAELSRLIYKNGSKLIENNPLQLGRDHFLRKVGLKEGLFISRRGTQCAIIEPIVPGDDNFAILVFRGTSDGYDILTDLEFCPSTWHHGGLVHTGFKKSFDLIWDEIDDHLSTICYPIFYTGHSLGGALATLAASKRAPNALYTFGSPRVGDRDFACSLENLQVYRMVNNRDIVPTLPKSWGKINYVHVGELCWLNHSCSEKKRRTDQTVQSQLNGRDVPKISATGKSGSLLPPPQVLVDHAPVNYVALLEEKLSK